MLEELRHFVLVVEQGTLTRAAKAAHLSQPALTASLQRLEAQVGARLLDRGRRGARLTAAGAALLPRAQAALAAVAAGQRAVAEVEGLSAGEIRLGGGATACTYLLPPIVAAFRARYPGVRFRLRELFTPHIQDAIDAGQLDLGIAAGAPPPGRGDPWLTDPLVLVASPEYAARLSLGVGVPLPPETPVVSFGPGSALRALLDTHLPDVDVVMELHSIAAVKGLVRAGVGATLISLRAVEVDLQLGRLVRIPDPRVPPYRSLCLLHGGEAHLPPAAVALRKMLLERR